MCCKAREGRKNACLPAPLTVECALTGRRDGPQTRCASEERCAASKYCDRIRSGRHAKLKSDSLLGTLCKTLYGL